VNVQEERELLSSISNNDWANVSNSIKWRALAWMCDAVAESETLRAQLQEHVDVMTAKPDKKVATGFDLFLAVRGGAARQREAQYEWDRTEELVKSGWIEKAKSIDKEQKKADRIMLEAEGKGESEKLSARVRHEPIGLDRESRRYWLLRRGPSDWLLSVEIGVQKPHVPPAPPYPVRCALIR